VLLIFCTSVDRLALLWSPFYRRISALIPTHFIELHSTLIDAYPREIPLGAKFHPAMAYSVSGLAQICASEIARRNNADLVIIPPEAVFADNAGEVITTHAARGAEVVFTSGPRLIRENIEARLPLYQKEPGAVAISPDELSALALKNLHQATLACIVNGKNLTYPITLWWRNGNNGLLGHCFRMHPILVSAAALRRSCMRRFESIDCDFVNALFPYEEDWSKISVVTDANEIFMFELKSRAMIVPRLFAPAHPPAAHWITQVMRPLNYWLFKQEVHLGVTEPFVKPFIRQDIDRIVDCYQALGNAGRIGRPKQSGVLISESTEITALIRARRFKPSGIAPRATRREQKAPDDLKVIYSLAVWGERYVDRFVSVSLPSLLSDRNLWRLKSLRRSLFLVHTDAEGRRILDSSIQFHSLKQLVRVVHRPLPSSSRGDNQRKYDVLSKCQSEAIAMAHGYDCLVFLYADFVWSDGTISAGLNRIAQGHDAVVMPVPPLVAEEFSAEILKHASSFMKFHSNGIGHLTISPRDLVRLGKEIMHPIMRDNTVDYVPNTANLAYVLWLGPNDDYLIRCFHIHPLALRVQNENPGFWRPFVGTLDEDFMPRVLRSFDRIYCIPDSDEAAAVSLTPRSFCVPYLPDGQQLDADKISRWAKAYAAPLHEMLFRHASIWHSEGVDAEAWAPVVAKSAMLADAVKSRVSMPDSRLAFEVIDQIPPARIMVEILVRIAAMLPNRVRSRIMECVPSVWLMRLKGIRTTRNVFGNRILSPEDADLAVLGLKDLAFVLVRSALKRGNTR
jgi:hypothetical protein